MTYDTYRYIFIGAAIAAVFFLFITIILLFVLKIPKVIGELSGAAERRAVDEIRRQNENSGTRSFKKSTPLLTREGLDETAILPVNSGNETTVLAADMTGTAIGAETSRLDFFVIEKDITFIHTNEVLAV